MFASCVVDSCQDFAVMEAKVFSVQNLGLQSVYGEKRNSDFRVGVEIVKRT